MVIAIRNGYGEPSSNHGLDCISCSTNTLVKVTKLIILTSAIGTQ